MKPQCCWKQPAGSVAFGNGTEIHLYAAEPGPMGVAGPDVSKAVRQMVESKGIRYHPEHQISHVDGTARLLKFVNGVEASYDLLAYVPPHRAPGRSSCRGANLGERLDLR